MTEPGRLLAKGRAADVFEHGDGLVLRRYRIDVDCAYEARVMQYVASHGYPVPRVASVAGRDLVMERLDGPTMLSDFSKRPWLLFRHVATIAGLIKRLHEIPPPDWLRPKLGDPGAIVHMDLHPDNVMLASRGPVVIDWSNAGHGDPDAEVADLWLIGACATAPGNFFERAVIGTGRKLFVRSLLGHFDRDAVARRLDFALEARSHDRNMSAEELARMRALVERFGR